MKSKLFYRLKDSILHIGWRWDRMAQSEETVIDFAHAHINDEPKKMIDRHKFSLEYNLAHYGELVNAHYREDRRDATDWKIAGMVEEHHTDVDLILYRGVCDYVYNLMIKNAQVYDDCDLYEKGFLATSLVKGCEFYTDIHLRIYVPAGSKVVYQGNVDDEGGSYEVDVMHGAKLKIISMDKRYINCSLVGTK